MNRVYTVGSRTKNRTASKLQSEEKFPSLPSFASSKTRERGKPKFKQKPNVHEIHNIRVESNSFLTRINVGQNATHENSTHRRTRTTTISTKSKNTAPDFDRIYQRRVHTMTHNPARPVGFQNPEQVSSTSQYGQDAGGAGSETRGGQAEYVSSGSFTKITPDQAKRNKLLQQRSQEEQNYQAYKERSRPSYVRTVPNTTGGSISQEARLKQLQREHERKKFEQTMKRRKWEEEKKAIEEAEYAEKKRKAREQTERNRAKTEMREGRLSGHHVSTNDAFLRRLEQQSRRSGGDYYY